MCIIGLRGRLQRARRPLKSAARAGWLMLIAGIAVGCATRPLLPYPTDDDAAPFVGGAVQVGDQVKVSFPGAPNLNMVQPLRADGMLSLGTLGEVKVAGKTPKEVEAELLVKEVTVAVESAGFPVFVSGAVTRPGRVQVNRSVTVVEAIMEAGGYDANRANLKRVQIVRQENGTQRTLVIDLEKSLRSPKSRPFHLRPSDVVIVPEKFVFF